MLDGQTFLVSGGRMGALIRAHDWAATPLGSLETWPQSLRTAVSLMISSGHPMFIAWGPELAFLYNDAYASVLGAKHPQTLGWPFRRIWPEIWKNLEPLIEQALSGEATRSENLHLVMERNGFPENTWYTFSYSPIRDETGGVGGIFCACTETTSQVLADRKRTFLLTLEERLRGLTNPHDLMAAASDVLGRHLDVPGAGYGEIDARREVIPVEKERRQNHTSGASLTWKAPVSDALGPGEMEELKAGRLLVVEDCGADAHAGRAFTATRGSLGCGALLVAPLVEAGRLRGFLYLHDTAPRRWAKEEVALVRETAKRTSAAAEQVRTEVALRESEARWRGLFEAMHEGFALCEMVYGPDGTAVDFRYLEVNTAWERLTGLPSTNTVGYLASRVLQGAEKFWIAPFDRVVATGEPAQFEIQVASIGRWFEVFVYRTEPGRFAALFLNITERKEAEERQALLTREVNHRAKNALAVVLAAVRMTKAPDQSTYIQIIEGRLGALARAQTLLAEDRWAGADLGTLLRGELAPFLSDRTTCGPSAELEGPSVTLPAGAAQPLAMALHELATNAVKYGALSVPTGRLAISWRLTGGRQAALHLCWAEAGGPHVAGAPARRGFGSRVLEGTVKNQLGGALSLAWTATGLVCDIEVPLARKSPEGRL